MPRCGTLVVVCGRFVARNDPGFLAERFSVTAVAERTLPPNFNTAPTQDVYIVRQTAAADSPGGRRLDIARWGLVPSWARDPSLSARMINARVETVAEKPSYRASFASRRCIVPVDGFYEWQSPPPGSPSGRRKQPYYLHRADDAELALAGLYDWWRDPAVTDAEDPAAWLLSTTILTTAARGPVARIHDRSPVIVAPHLWDDWLDPQIPGREVIGQILASEAGDDPAGDAGAVWRIDPVSTAVNSVRNNGPELLAPVAG